MLQRYRIEGCGLHDRLSRGRSHTVSLWGGLALVASVPLRFAVSQTESWHLIAMWLIR